MGHQALWIREYISPELQPIRIDNYSITFNGELYPLNAEGEKTNLSEVEIIQNTVKASGVKGLSSLSGMYSIVVYDHEAHRLYFIRDKSGQKPLFIRFKNLLPGINCAWSSELESLREISLTWECNAKLINRSISMSNFVVYGSDSTINDIESVKPGSILTVELENFVKTNETFGKINCNIPKFSKGEGPLQTALFEDLFSNVVSAYLTCFGNPALLLSGGIDSTLIFASSLKSNREIAPYTMMYQDCPDEFNWDGLRAIQISEYLGKRTKVIEFSKRDYLSCFLRSLEYLDFPVGNISIPSYLYISEQLGYLGLGHRVVLSGSGGDETFSGYPRYVDFIRHKNYVRRIALKLINRSEVDEFYLERALDSSFRSLSRDEIKDVRKILRGNSREKDALKQLLHLDRDNWLINDSFQVLDRFGMQNQIEYRAPFMDCLVQEFSDKLTEGQLIQGVHSKVILQEVLRPSVPSWFLPTLKKKGWKSPINYWLQTDDKFKRSLNSIILELIPTRNESEIQWADFRNQTESIIASGQITKQVASLVSSAVISRRISSPENP
jgi:asparagine synthase (glutamine-hydrolysing)